MSHDEDLAAFLPYSPPPRPDRRKAAIDAAMRRFDGDGMSRPGAAAVLEKPVPWMRQNRSLVGAFASMALVVSIGLPVWLASDFGPRAGGLDRPERVPAPQPNGARATRPTAVVPGVIVPKPIDRRRSPEATLSSQPADRAEHAASLDVTASRSADAETREKADARLRAPSEDNVVASSTVSPPPAPPPPPPPPPPALAVPPPAAVAAPAPAAQSRATGDVVVTGSRVRADRARSARGDIAQPTRSFRLARPVADTCTVADPRRDIEACRSVFEATVPSDIRPFIADGVSRAWRGDLKGAGAAFDRAIVRSPRSAFAYYNRSLVFSRRGETRRAEADKDRAAGIDARYRDDAD